MAEGDDDKDATIAQLRKDGAAMRVKLRETEAHVAQLEAAQADQDKVIERARAEGSRETTERLRAEHGRAMAQAEIRAAAARQLADPEDAVRFVDLDPLIGADGKIDRAGIKTALDDLIEKKPYLVQSTTPPPPVRPSGGGDGGARPIGSADPDQPMNEMIRKAVKRG